MKLTWLLPVILLANYTAQSALVGWWKHDEANGNIVDSSGMNPEGIPFGTPGYGSPGVPNGTYGSITVNNAQGASISFGPSTVDAYFVAGNDNINPVMNIDRAAQLTVMGWLRPATPELANSHTYRMIGTGSTALADGGWGLGLRLTLVDGALVPFARFTGYSVVDKDAPIPPSSLVYDQWIHLAATYDNGVTNLFLNGDLLGTHADTRLFNNDAAANRLAIGGRLGGPNNDQANGLIDGLRVYDSILTLDEIRAAAAASVTAVPEPTVAVLALLGAPLVARRRRRIL